MYSVHVPLEVQVLYEMQDQENVNPNIPLKRAVGRPKVDYHAKYDSERKKVSRLQKKVDKLNQQESNQSVTLLKNELKG